jgi:hypothetical protein
VSRPAVRRASRRAQPRARDSVSRRGGSRSGAVLSHWLRGLRRVTGSTSSAHALAPVRLLGHRGPPSAARWSTWRSTATVQQPAEIRHTSRSPPGEPMGRGDPADKAVASRCGAAAISSPRQVRASPPAPLPKTHRAPDKVQSTGPEAVARTGRAAGHPVVSLSRCAAPQPSLGLAKTRREHHPFGGRRPHGTSTADR